MDRALLTAAICLGVGACGGSGTVSSGGTTDTATGGTSGGAGATSGSSGGGTTGGPSVQCTPGGDGGYYNAPYPLLSQYCLVAQVDGQIVPLPGSVPYDLNTPFFADYAVKYRTVWMPPGTSATYDPSNVFTLPDGTIFTKSFGWNEANLEDVSWVETRVEMLVNGTWVLQAYRWNDGGTDAEITSRAETVTIPFYGPDGGQLASSHLIPSSVDCFECHDSSGANAPIGPKARQLNRNFTYPDGTTQNQLAWWSDAGLLKGAPDPSQAPVLPVWNDPSTGTVAQRARAYLEGNCANCHNPNGYASNTGLDFSSSDSLPSSYGVCVAPDVFSIDGQPYILDPDDPGNSLVEYLMASTTVGKLMPPLGRSLEDIPGVSLIGEWIGAIDGGGLNAALDGGCS